MIRLARTVALVVAAGCFLIAALGASHAAGALAVGACGAYGYGFDFRQMADARVAAIKKCTGKGRLRGRGGRCQAAVRLLRLGHQFASRQSGKCLAAPLL